jgi:uncharacterized protein YqgQ
MVVCGSNTHLQIIILIKEGEIFNHISTQSLLKIIEYLIGFAPLEFSVVLARKIVKKEEWVRVKVIERREMKDDGKREK